MVLPIFEELVPKGSASLGISVDDEVDLFIVIVCITDATKEETASQASQPSQISQGSATAKVKKYNGISIRVSFNDKEENQVMSQLSGGQKSFVALVLVSTTSMTISFSSSTIEDICDSKYRSCTILFIR